MTTLKFVFNKDKVAAAGTTEDALLAPMREHAAKYGIDETEYGVFSKDGEDEDCIDSSRRWLRKHNMLKE